jgi:acetaldehyde dehydrogenase
MTQGRKLKVAIIGSGNIGTDLMIKVMRHAQHLEMGAMVGVDAASDGLARAQRLGIPTTAEGLQGLLKLPVFSEIDIAFDATSAAAHSAHDRILREHGVQVIDLTPAAIGPYVIPPINLDQVDAPNINMVTCGGQATIPIVAAVSRIAPVYYGEIVASISSKSAGPGTRANIDEFTETTRLAIEKLGGAQRGKAIIVLNPAEPPLIMRDTVFVLSEAADKAAVEKSIEDMVKVVQGYVPGYRLKQKVQFEDIAANAPLNVPGIGPRHGLNTSVFLEVEGAAHYLPAYAGNLDIMTSAALACGDRMALRRMENKTSRSHRSAA